jgi:hypothetical protein
MLVQTVSGYRFLLDVELVGAVLKWGMVEGPTAIRTPERIGRMVDQLRMIVEAQRHETTIPDEPPLEEPDVQVDPTFCQEPML